MPLTPSERLSAAYRDRYRAARAAKAAGQRVIGFVDPAVPMEYAVAAGALPILIMPDLKHATPVADKLIEPRESWALRSVAERALDGSLAFLDLLVIGHRDEWLYYNLKEAVRIGEGAQVPPLALCDLIQDIASSVDAYNQVQLESLKNAVEHVAGARVNERGLKRALSLTNRRRDLQRQLMVLRDAGHVEGTHAMEALGACFFMDTKTYCATLADALNGFETSVVTPRPRLLLLSSQLLFHTRLHEAIEAAGATVAAEDSWCGARLAARPIAPRAETSEAIRSWYVAEVQGEEVRPREQREEWLLKRLQRGDLSGVLLQLARADRQFGWNVPGLERLVRDRGLPFHVLHEDADREVRVTADLLRPWIGSLTIAPAEAAGA